MEIDIDDFNIGNINNYNEIRKCTMSSNKATFRTVFMFSSKTLKDYATRVECLNNIPDDEEIREPIDSSQLFYAEQEEIEIQVSRVTNYENRARKQPDIENAPALKSISVQYVDNDIIII